ncbi:MAG: hypothetical protein ACD_42C00396G0007 [uncultured bacterium]|nr:MAG: hypothetical protein ACD_42C00396G0007 [uncultured bacterium]OGT33363.1 MAG: hypothetical protein A3C44_04025 [Gammaproteobacteria bacterium RIFCSPHIGHO2_02_FULL_39_13]OGT50304.1 MAG: hypothetical protein A3E53_00950 [Gammaproteobacteria bacterium RIFCSPHIGHO2_12_FULL_39_24]
MNIKNRLENLADRERRIALVGGVLVAALIFYAVIWSPLSSAVDDSKKQLYTQRSLLLYLKKSSQKIQQLKASGVTVSVTSNADLLSVLEQSLSSQSLSSYLKQVNEPQQNQFALTFKAVPFDKLMQWLQMMSSTHGVTVKQLSATRLMTVGLADVQITLSR